MGHKFAEIAFTPTVKKAQEQSGSRRSYARLEEGEVHHDSLALQLPFLQVSDSMGNHDSEIVDARSVD